MGINELRVSDEVAARLGEPTVESLRTRLSQQATCLSCHKPLGQGPVAVVGQQVQDQAVVIGTHPGCRASAWIDADALGEVSLPTALPIEGPAVALGLRRPVQLPPALRWLSWFLQTTVPTLVAFPEPEWVWVRLVGPGETVNDDLLYYRDRFGLVSDPYANVPRIDGQAWLDEHGQLCAGLGDHRFAAAVETKLEHKVRKIGRMRLILVSGANIGSELQVKLSDIFSAVADGRAAFGWLPVSSSETDSWRVP